jgi:hypothetical protein
MESSTNGRVMRQPKKDTLRDWLRSSAERIEKLTAELLWWQEHHEQAVADALAEQGGLPRWGWLVLAALAGGFAVAIAEAVLA